MDNQSITHNDGTAHIIFVWLVIMITAIILLQKNEANFLAFIIPWFIGLVGCLTVVFGIL